MTEPDDETRSQPAGAPAPADAAADEPPSTTGAAGGDAAPDEPPSATDTAAADTVAGPTSWASPTSSASPASSASPTSSAGPTSTAGEPLRPDPNRPTDSGWREPPWFPARDRARRDRDRRPSPWALLLGFLLIGIGVWYFLDRTLGIAMPRLAWNSVWPVLLIVIGGVILVRSFDRRT